VKFKEQRQSFRQLAGVALFAVAGLFTAPALPDSRPAPAATVKTATLDVRSEMSADGSVVKVLKKGDKVMVGLELQVEGSDWCEVSESGKNVRLGYVPCQALERPAPPKAESTFAASGAGVADSQNAGVQVLLGKAAPTSNPASKAAPARQAPAAGADKRFITGGDVEAPDFTLDGLDGQPLSLHDLRGHYVLLDFWATWCGPCRIEMPRIDDLQKAYADRGLEVVGINAGESPDRVRRFIEQNGYSYTILLDPQNQASRRYNAEYLPTLVVIDPSGDVRFYDSGDYSERDLRAVLARVGLR
jgi:thiol-disulfide isomerase/thioredoxin